MYKPLDSNGRRYGGQRETLETIMRALMKTDGCYSEGSNKWRLTYFHSTLGVGAGVGGGGEDEGERFYI